ncbi:alpha/beta fold hydrolase [Amycolatopsis jiangsuensis]|uniref:Pimeloyl-ACP methyl ester carboxylesterase n=1 Tax=Amycolatopsis jiangsuensis TaxID=1181879 RepID=A0A840IVF1_9PSEU|nr:alpha/beta hydrolase [Amycolatopsis jiangsuensis]MBB4685743.1 pimeloyl-ACP methyl ester carboxylesterase [Amycolatopsis jiangsuensis]
MTVDSGTTRELTLDGCRLRYREAGRGEPLLLLHGYPQSHLTWRHQIGSLAARRRVIAPDWPGWGASGRSRALGCEYDVEVARLGRLLDALGLDRVDLAGHDYGGFLGLGFVLGHPERIGRFAILNSRAHRTFPAPYYQLFGLLGILGRRPVLRELLARLPIGGMNRIALARYVRKDCFDHATLGHYLGWLDTREGRRWFAHYFAGYDVRPRPELDAGLSSIRCPTTVIWGDQDPATPFAIGEDLARRIPGATLVRIRGADHYVMEERPDEVTAALTTWLGETR